MRLPAFDRDATALGALMPLEPTAVRRDNGTMDVVVLCADEVVRDVIAYWFTSLPARTFVADDGYHANRILKEGPRRWLVTDRVLPPWPGLDTFLNLRDRHPSLRIAFIDNGNLDDSILARVTGATVLLHRPLTRQAVVEALARSESVL